jgi:hypothetical protein
MLESLLQHSQLIRNEYQCRADGVAIDWVEYFAALDEKIKLILRPHRGCAVCLVGGIAAAASVPAMARKSRRDTLDMTAHQMFLVE